MNRKFKALGLALMAVFALSAVAASSASAVNHEFTASKTPVVLTGEQHINKHIFSIGAAKVECGKVKFVGTVAASPANTVTVAPEYKECVFEPFGAAEVKVNHCAYILGSDTTVGNEPGVEHAAVEVECTEGNSIEIVAPGCTTKVAAQKNLHGVSYTNVTGSKKEVTGHVTIKKIAYTKAGPSCFLISGEAQYNGTFIVKGFEDTKKVEGTDLTTPASYTHNGVQVDVTTTP